MSLSEARDLKLSRGGAVTPLGYPSDRTLMVLPPMGNEFHLAGSAKERWI